jgi:hypothetical protein
MSLVLSYDDTKQYKLPDPGTYNARCVRIIELGTQLRSFNGDSKESEMCLMDWELFGEEGPEAKPYLINARYTLSLHPESSLRKILKSWRGRDFTPEELAGFDLYNVLGKDCLLSIIHNKSAEKTYANVAGVSPLMKGMVGKLKAFEATTPLLYFSLVKAGQIGFQTDWDAVPVWVQNIIKKSKEWPDVLRKMGKTDMSAFSTHNTQPAAIAGDDSLTEDELPF